MKLRLIKLQPPEEEPRVLDQWSPGFSSQEAIRYLEEYTDVPLRPVSNPQMPVDVTLIASIELGYLHASFVAFLEYLDVQRALAEVHADEEEALLAHVKAEIRLRKSGTVPDKEAKCLNDAQYIEVEIRCISARARAKLMKARVVGLERCAAALSREMTRRGIEQEHVG